MTFSTSSESRPAPSTEVVRFPDVDVVINHAAVGATYADNIKDLFKEGELPENWQSPNSTNQAYGEINGHKFFAKAKNASGKSNYASLKELRYDMAEEQALSLEGLQSSLAILRRANSLLSEIKLANDVKKIIESETAQTIAQAHGFRGIRYAEPILGVVNRRNGKKIMVYEYVEGSNYAAALENSNSSEKTDEHETLLGKFRNLFTHNGIEANDLEDRQFLIDNDSHLVLTDVEQYRKLPQSKENQVD